MTTPHSGQFTPRSEMPTLAPMDIDAANASARCLLCAGPLRAWMNCPLDWRRPEAGGPLQLMWCDRCSLGRLHPIPSPAEAAAAYRFSDYYTHQPARAVTGDARNLSDRLREHLAWRLDFGRSISQEADAWAAGRRLRVLDLGCGNGGLMAELGALGHDVLGVEPDADACRQATAAGHNVLQGPVEALPVELSRRRFDLVILSHVLEHVRDPLAAVQTAAAHVAPGGGLLIEVPNNEARGRESSGAAWCWLDAPRHLHFFTAGSLQRICRGAGLHVQRLSFRGYHRQFCREWIETDQQIHDTLARHAPQARLPARNSANRAWLLLLQTALAAPRRRYDSVRVIALPTS